MGEAGIVATEVGVRLTVFVGKNEVPKSEQEVKEAVEVMTTWNEAPSMDMQ